MSSVLTPRPCRNPYSSSPKSSPTGPTTRTSVKKEAASEKCTAEPPSMRSRCPNGVCTASKAIDPTTTRLMRPRRLAGLDRDTAPRNRRRLHDRRGRLTEDDEAVDHLFQMSHVAHVRLHEVTVVAGHAVALDDLCRLAREPGDIRELPRRRPHADHGGQREPERLRVHVRVVRADDAVGLQSLQPLGHGRSRQADATAELCERDARIALELADDPAVGLVKIP